MNNSNFRFLEEKWPLLAELGEMAEKYLHTDPNTCMIKLRMFGETLSRYIMAEEGLEEPEEMTQVARLSLIRNDGALPGELINLFHSIRKAGNKATHEGYAEKTDAVTQMKFARHLAVWFKQTYDEYSFEPASFCVPEAPPNTDELMNQLKKQEDKYEQEMSLLKDKLEELKQAAEATDKKERRQKGQRAAVSMQLTEEETRKLIDEQLQNAGWEADTQRLRYSNGTRPEKGRNIAIAEWPAGKGWADYALFSGLDLIAIVEAKRKSKDVPADLEQAKEYARNITIKDDENLIDCWGEYRVPFLFATNGRSYLKQLETKSGIWFIDVRRNTNHPRALQSWYTPEGLLQLMEQDVDAAGERLKKEPYDYLELRDYQEQAIAAVESAIAEGNREILIAMATGTGKTRTIIGLAYRLIKMKRFKRILFLVDRSALGQQAEDAFKEARLEDLMTFTQIFDLKGIKDKKPEETTRLHISTVQGLVKRILYPSNDEDIPAIDQYDCIVVDEAHRGYILDKEMGDVELEFRDQSDYVSKFRKVLEYFDAVKVGMTATPAPHTTEIFGKPVYTYTYREAVIDGWLVDHEPPQQITTKLKTEGIKWSKGETAPIYDPVTGQITNSDELPDELSFEIDDFNKKVINENFNRTVIKELVKEIDPEGWEKTLIFAATDNHADMIVDLLKQEYHEAYGGVDDDAIVKITGSIKDPIGMIRKYRNEMYPSIAVTVDLLTTGVDVLEICNLVFMRRVKSRILYEQMLGRATRLADHIGKTHFNIYDAVGLYEALAEVINMKPVVQRPNVDFKTLISELQELNDPAEQNNHVNQIAAKLQRKKGYIKDKNEETFKALADGMTINEFIHWLRQADIADIKKKLDEGQNLIAFLDEVKKPLNPVFLSYHEDELISVDRGYGIAEKPEDYLQSFNEFINNNINIIPALIVVCQRPQELTRKELRELKFVLDQQGFTETNLQTAWREAENVDIAADIISFIRQQALGDALVSHEERIKKAMQNVYAMHPWSKVQQKWLARIEKQLLKESIIDRESLNEEPFRAQGGYVKINRIFNEKIDEIIETINESLYA